jgi:hypothetical protein
MQEAISVPDEWVLMSGPESLKSATKLAFGLSSERWRNMLR